MRNFKKLVGAFLAAGLVAFGSAELLVGPSELRAFPQAQSASPQQGPGASLGVFPYPTKGQDAAQQQKDEGECYAWSKQQTGIDPAAPPPPPQQAQQAKGGAVKGAAKGAAGGAAVGAIAGDTGDGAAIGATAGAVRGRRQQKKANKQAQQQAQAAAGQQQQQTLDTFKKAFGGCMVPTKFEIIGNHEFRAFIGNDGFCGLKSRISDLRYPPCR